MLLYSVHGQLHGQSVLVSFKWTVSMYNPWRAVYSTAVSGRFSSDKPKGNQRVSKLWPRPQTADSGGALSYSWAHTATVTTKCQLATSAPTRFTTESPARQLFCSMCYDDVHQLRTYGTLQRTYSGLSSNSRSATTGYSTGLIWEHRRRYRRKQARKRQWLTKALRLVLSMGYDSQ